MIVKKKKKLLKKKKKTAKKKIQSILPLDADLSEHIEKAFTENWPAERRGVRDAPRIIDGVKENMILDLQFHLSQIFEGKIETFEQIISLKKDAIKGEQMIQQWEKLIEKIGDKTTNVYILKKYFEENIPSAPRTKCGALKTEEFERGSKIVMQENISKIIRGYIFSGNYQKPSDGQFEQMEYDLINALSEKASITKFSELFCLRKDFIEGEKLIDKWNEFLSKVDKENVLLNYCENYILNQDGEQDKLETSSSDDISFSSGEIDISDEDILLKHKKELTDQEIGDMKARGKLPFKGELIPAIRVQDKEALKILLRARNIEAKSLKKTLKKDSSSSSRKTLKRKVNSGSSSSSEKKLQIEQMMKNILLEIYINLESLPGGGSRVPREIIKYLKEESMEYPEFWDADNVIGYIYRDEWSKLIEISKKEYGKTEKIKKTVKKKSLQGKKTVKKNNLFDLLTRYQSIPDKLKGETIFKLTDDKLSKDCLNKTFILKNINKVVPPGIHPTWSVKVTEVKKRYKINLEYSSRKCPVKKQYWWNPKKRDENGNPASLFQKEINDGYSLVELKNN